MQLSMDKVLEIKATTPTRASSGSVAKMLEIIKRDYVAGKFGAKITAKEVGTEYLTMAAIEKVLIQSGIVKVSTSPDVKTNFREHYTGVIRNKAKNTPSSNILEVVIF